MRKPTVKNQTSGAQEKNQTKKPTVKHVIRRKITVKNHTSGSTETNETSGATEKREENVLLSVLLTPPEKNQTKKPNGKYRTRKITVKNHTSGATEKNETSGQTDKKEEIFLSVQSFLNDLFR